MAVSWTGEGALIRTRSSFHFDAGPDFKFHSRNMSRFREAVADGSVVGLDDFGIGSLGTSDFASIASFRDATVQIGSGGEF